MNKKFENKVVLITGGSTGIGFGVAKRFAKEGIADGLIDAHLSTRNHINSLLEGITDKEWKSEIKGPWNFQSLGVEILNFEIRMINLVHPDQFDKVSDDITLSNFYKKFSEVSSYMICAIEYENSNDGILWKTDEHTQPSMHWVMMRTNSHDMYHAGGITVVREHLGIKRADYANWTSMADGQFYSSFKQNLAN